MASQRPSIGARVVVDQNCKLDVWDFGGRRCSQDGAVDLLEGGYLASPYIAAAIDNVELILVRRGLDQESPYVRHRHIS